MHKKIIWGFFLSAFILDILRSKYSLEGKEKNIEKNKEETLITNEKGKKFKKNKMKAENNGEENKVTNDSDEYYEKENKLNNDDENVKSIKSKKISNKKRNKSIKENIDLRIQFCQSWSHRGYFNQVKEYFEKNYSNILVTPDNYPLSSTRKFLSRIVTIIQISVIVLVFTGESIKRYTNGIIPNEYIDWIGGNKLMTGMIGFFGGNMINNFITSTGAFEIYCNDDLIWSAINNGGKVPQIEGIVELIKKSGNKLFR